GLVGIVRNEREMAHALDALGMFGDRARRIRIGGNRAYNPAWHTALDLHNLLTVSEAIARSALERKESRGAHFREDFPDKVAEFGRVNIVIARETSGEMRVRREPIPEMHLRNSCTRSMSCCAILQVPSGASGGRGRNFLIFFFTSKFQETSVTRSRIFGNDFIGSMTTGCSSGRSLRRVMHIRRGRPFTSAEQEPHFPALQFQRTARSLACSAWMRCTASSTTIPSETSVA